MPGGETKFFVSYARKDTEFVLTLAKSLRAAGANLWVDQLDIRKGDNWVRAAQQALDACEGMLLILSPEAVDSDKVMEEWNYALEEKKRVVPLIFRECKIPARLRLLQHIDFPTVGEVTGMVQVREALGLEPSSIPEVAPSAPTGTIPAPKLTPLEPATRATSKPTPTPWVPTEVTGTTGAGPATEPRPILEEATPPATTVATSRAKLEQWVPADMRPPQTGTTSKPTPTPWVPSELSVDHVVEATGTGEVSDTAPRSPTQPLLVGDAGREEGHAAANGERHPKVEVAELRPEREAKPPTPSIEWRRRALWVAVGGLALLGVLIPWREWASMSAVRFAAEEQARREQEAKKEQERQATPEREAKAFAGMVRIPAGEFWMGCNEKVKECGQGEKPGGSVNVDAFSIDRTEVTVAEYQECVKAGKCEDPDREGYCNWGKSGRDNHPINCVDWSQAKAYCEWAGKRLPTEAEWEKAARGTDGRIYPWGNDWSESKANVGVDGTGDGTKPVGSYPSGASPYGAVDMAGNVSEWVVDEVAGGGPAFRGGSWKYDLRRARASYRYRTFPFYRDEDVGFRCAQSR